MWPRKNTPVDKSREALAESIQSLKKTELRAAPVADVTTALRTLRERNHFAEQLQSIMGGPR